jgi:hypothetical protein
MLPAPSSDFAGDGGGGIGRESKYVGSPDEVAFSGGSPGISRSNPALMNVTPCVAPQSDVTKPLKPISIDINEWLQRNINAHRSIFAANQRTIIFRDCRLKVAATPMVAVGACAG